MRPLDGVRILDLTRLLPGAYATLLLADLGADVVKVEDPRGGDPARAMPPLSGGASVYFRILNRNKRSLTLDLRSPEAAGVLDALVSRADVIVESFRPRTSRRLGVDADTLRGRHPRLVCASITGFGQTGPYADRAAHDINYEALGGILMASASRHGPPRMPRMLVADIGAAMNASAGILAALFQRERTGVGAAVDVSIHESALSWLLFPAAHELVAGGDPKGSDARELPIDGRDACYNIYQTADGEYVALGALELKFWSAFCQTIGRPDLIPLHDARGDDRARTLAEVRALMRTRTRDEWLARFSGIDVCLTPVNTVAAAIHDPHVAARGAVVRHGGSAYVTTPIAVTDEVTDDGWNRARRVDVQPAPALGAHTDAVLSEAGLGPADIARLRERGVI